MNLYTIIITYNGVKWIEKNIQALIDSSTKTKIIIIDNIISNLKLDVKMI